MELITWILDLIKKWLSWLLGDLSLDAFLADPVNYISSLNPIDFLGRCVLSIVVIAVSVSLIKLLFKKGLSWLFGKKGDSK